VHSRRDCAEKLGGNDQQHGFGIAHRARQIGCRRDAALDRHIGEEERISFPGVDRLGDLRLARPQRDLLARAPRRAGHGGSERTGADHGYSAHGLPCLRPSDTVVFATAG